MTLRRPRPVRAVAALAAAAALVAACTQTPDGAAPAVGEQRTAQLDTATRQSLLTLAATDQGRLSAQAQRQLERFLAEHPPGTLHVAIRPGNVVGERAADALVGRLRRAGVPAGNIARLPIAQGGSGDLLLHARTTMVRFPACPDWRRPSAMAIAEGGSSNFGCADALNLGRMVADPRDLAIGRRLAPAPAETGVGALDALRGSGEAGSPSGASGPPSAPALRGAGASAGGQSRGASSGLTPSALQGAVQGE